MARQYQRLGWLCASMLAVEATSSLAASLKDPIPFESTGGQLNLIVTAIEGPVDFGNVRTTGWVYDVCRRASASKSCLPGTSTRPYGGVWLKLKPNDTLRIRLVNKLPPVPDALHCNPDLVNNPTNLHTHGLIVEPHRSTGGSDPYGDYVFVEIQNPHNHGSCATPAASARNRPPLRRTTMRQAGCTRTWTSGMVRLSGGPPRRLEPNPC